MNAPPHDRLYKLLPAIYRLREAGLQQSGQGEPLRALLSIIEQELNTVEDDITRLYDNWFIETCAPWVVPYIGDLLDVRDLYADQSATYGQQERRAYVANTLAYRRRKGTTPVLEQLARDVTGWRSRAVEFSRLLLTTQQLNHERPGSATVNLRADSLLGQIGTPFERQAAYTPEIRSAEQGGRYALSHVGLFIWRLQNYPIERSTARVVAGADREPTGRYYTFNPLGYDIPLFNQPQTETNITNLAQEINVPGTLRCLALSDELNERHRLLLKGEQLEGIRYFDRDPVLQIFVNGQPNPIPAEELLICSLKEQESEPSGIYTTESSLSWRSPPYDDAQEYSPLPTKVVAVDPELGRIAFLDQPLPMRVEVSYLYGFSDDVGGGPYARREADIHRAAPVTAFSEDDSHPPLISPLFWSVDPALSADPNPLATAILEWNQTTAAWSSLNQTSVPLARIQIPGVQVSQMNRDWVPRFAPGLVGDGLRVIGQPGHQQVIVTAGRAIDGQGRMVILREDLPVDLTLFDPSDFPNRTGILVTGYQSAAQKSARSKPVQLIPEAALKGYAPGTFIPLARVTLNDQNQLMGAPVPQVRLAPFQPGIIQGLEIKIRPGTLDAIVTAGMAVDSQGRRLITIANQSLDLKPYQGERRWVVISRDTRLKGRSRIELVRQEDLTRNANRLYIALATLDIPQVKITLNDIAQLAETREFITPITNSRSTSPATVISVNPTSPDQAIVKVSAGTVMNAQQKPLTLEQDCQFDLSSYAARTVVLFMSPQTGLGLPLTPVSPPNDQSWQRIGIVPQEPSEPNTGVILIKGNQSYPGDLFVAIPATRQLKLIAADGYRPHVQGNLYVQGTASDAEVGGRLQLDGLLIEGHLTVLAGNLKHLDISHCTLVPLLGGLRIKKGRVVSPQPVEDDTTLIAVVMFFLSLMRQLNGGHGAGCASSQTTSQKSIQIIQFALQQITQLISEIWQGIQNWQCAEDSDGGMEPCLGSDPSILKQDNPQLEIDLTRSICGPLYLTDTVPKLTIADSLIDKGHPQPEGTSGTAIAAPGTAVEITTSTVLGMSTVRSLEASNSIFTEKVTALRHQVGCVRFSHIPEGSQTPRRYQCQPDLVFKQELDTLPEAIAALGAMPQWAVNQQQAQEHETPAFLLLGTNGGGVFRSWENGKSWENITHNLPDRHITAILVYPQAGIGIIRSQDKQVTGIAIPEGDDQAIPTTQFTQQLRPGDHLTVNGQTRTVTDVLNDASLLIDTPFTPDLVDQPFQINTLLVGIPGGDVFRSRDAGETWIQTGLFQTNATITTWLHTQQPGTGTLTANRINLTGEGTRFASELRVGDTITLSIPSQNQDSEPRVKQTRRVMAIGYPGTGTLSSQGTTVTGHNTNFAAELKRGDTLTALGHTRTVVKLIPEQPNQVEIDTPFPSDLPTATPFQINVDTILRVNAPFSLTPFSQTGFQINRLYAATAGGGVWRANDGGEHWQAINNGLTGWNVRALAVNPKDGQLFAGTAGNGVFRFAKSDSKTDSGGDRWVSANSRGLTNRTITALVIDPVGQLFAGTAGGGVFYSSVEEPDWMALNQGLSSLNVTTLQLGQLETATALGIAPPEPPVDNLLPLIMGTSDGKLFSLMTRGQPWQKLSLDFQGIDITALAVNPQTGALLVGTVTGEVLQMSASEQGWQSVSQGLLNVTKKLQIIDRLKPGFTSTRYGDPGYGQLSQGCANEIRTGAEEGAEMGVFYALKQPQREANLQASLEEYLRFGLEAVIFYVS